MLKKKRILFWLGYVFYLLIIIFLVDYFFYLSYKRKVIPLDLPSGKLSKIESRLGQINIYKKRSSFFNFKEKKGHNVVRIGCFGDSFTYGDEVGAEDDFPTLLQDIFSKKGYQNVEVINFGMSWYGFHQTFILWENIGKRYNLDYIVLGPECLHYKRDSTFNHAFPERDGLNKCILRHFGKSPSQFDTTIPIRYFHSRYVLQNDDVELVDVIGETHAERISNYWRFIPPLRYLLFDREAPIFLSAPVNFFLPTKQLKRNPFYYKIDVEKEMDDIYKILLSKMSDDAPQIILQNYKENIINLGKGLNRRNLFSVLLYWPRNFPYIAFRGHNTPCGNQLLSQQTFDCLTNKRESTLTILTTEDIDRDLVEGDRMKKLNLYEYKNMAVEMDNAEIGRFYYTFEPIKMASLLALKDEDTSILDAVFLPLDFELEENMTLVMRVERDKELKEYSLANVELFDRDLNIGMVNLDKTHFDVELPEESGIIFELFLRIRSREVLRDIGVLDKGDTVTILLKDTPILSAKIKAKDEVLKFTSMCGGFVIIRADGEKTIDIEALPSTGTIYLLLSTDRGGYARIPFAKWLKINKTIPLGEPRERFFPPFRAGLLRYADSVGIDNIVD